MIRLGLAVAAITLIADQATKLYFYDLLVIGGTRFVEVAPFFNLVTVWNYGVSFGMLTNDSQIGPWLFVAVAAAIIAALFTWLRRAANRMVAIALGMVIGGAIGNVVDRLKYGAVFDFLDFHAFGWHWPAFNLADSGISIGVILLLADGLLGDKRSTK